MPPKRVKSGTVSGAAAAAIGNKAWETGLSAAAFEEETWKASISLVVGEGLEDEMHICALRLAVQQPQRRLFSVISMDATVEKINELGNPKAKKTKDVPMFYEVMELAKSIMDAGEEIPIDLMGKLVKFQLLGIKTNDLQRVAEEKAKGKAGASSPTKDKGGAASKNPAKGDKGKKASEPTAPAKDTKLKRRGEEDETNKYIDDEPDDGPQHYIILWGFYQPYLISILDTLGIHVSNVIKLSSENADKLEGAQEGSGQKRDYMPLGKETEVTTQRQLELFWKHLEVVWNSGSGLSKLFDVVQLNYTVKETLLPQEMDNTEAMLAFGTHVFEDLACLIYDCLDWRRQHLHYLSNMRLIQVPTVFRAEPHNSPESSPEVVQTPAPQTPKRRSVPEETSPAEPEVPVLRTDVDMRYYSDLLGQIPPEVSSVPLILHCMLEQVVATEQEIPPHATAGLEQQADKPEKSLTDYMLSAILTLPQSAEEKKKLMEDLGVTESSQMRSESKHPLVLNYHDERARRLHQHPVLDSFDAIKVEADIMKKAPVWNLLHSMGAQSKTNKQLARTQELIHFCTDGECESLSWPEVQQVFHQFIFESMRLRGVDENSQLAAPSSEEPVPIPWDDPVSFAKHFYRNSSRTKESFNSQAGYENQKEEESLANKVNVTDLKTTQIRSLRDWNFAEHHNVNVFPQVLQSASQSYRCVDTFHGSQDTLFIVCHNPMSLYRSCKESWDVALHTDIGFRNYLEYVADSISEWTKQEEVKWQALQGKRDTEKLSIQTTSESLEKGKAESIKKKGNISPKQTTTSPLESPEPEECLPEQYIREDSLKAWKIEQDRLKEEEQVKKTKKDGKGGKAPPKAGDRSDSVKENKKTPSSTRKSIQDISKTPDLAVPPENERSELQSSKDGFTGYSMDGSIIQVRGQVQSLFPSDGGHIQVENIHFIQGSTQIKVCVMKDNHHFFTHISEGIREMEENQKDIFMDRQAIRSTNRTGKCGSFFAVLDSGIHLSYSHHRPTRESKGEEDQALAAEIEIPRASTLSPAPSEHLSPSGSPPDQATKQQEVQLGVPDGPPLQSLNVSIPSGLTVQFLYEDMAGSKAREKSILVRQSIPLCSDSPGAAHPPDCPLTSEFSRVITCGGNVIKHMRDGSTEVLFADGTVSTSPDSGPVFQSAPDIPTQEEEQVKDQMSEGKDARDRKGKPTSKMSMGIETVDSDLKEELKATAQVSEGSWTTTTPSGLRVATIGDRTVDASPILAYRATDPISETVVITREDKVLCVLDKDETVIVEHADGTRITTFYQEKEAQDNLNIGEKPNSMSRKDKLVMVERAGFATVVMNCDESSCNVFFGDGTVINGSCYGSYKIFPSSVGVLSICEDGNAVYSSDQDYCRISEVRTQRVQPNSYVMCHTADILCHVTDQEGILFQVMADGQTSVITSSLAENAVEEAAEGEGSVLRDNTGYKAYVPRFFMAHEDGSGTELLCSQDVDELLLEAHSDPTVAVLKEPIPEMQGVRGITVLKPCPQDVWSSWLIDKQNDDIIPTHLKSRKWDKFPSVERKTPGPQFGTTLGRGLSLMERPRPGPGYPYPPPVLGCPEVLVVRQIIQYQPVDDPLRRRLEARLMAYIEQLLKREELSEEMLVKDPRPVEERVHATDLLQLVLSLSDSDYPTDTAEKRQCAVDIASLYNQALIPALQPATTPLKNLENAIDSCTKEKPESLWMNRIERHRQEIHEEKVYQDALRNKIIPQYFLSDLGKILQLKEKESDMRSLSLDLPPFPKTGDSEIRFLKDSPPEPTHRPLNPTPCHAAGTDGVLLGRPTNPTPQTATAPHSSPVYRDRTQMTVSPVTTQVWDSAQEDVAGNPPRRRLKLPSSILSTKPSSVPNHRFLCVEEPVRRKVRTVSVTGLRPVPRGFELLPAKVHFGTLKEGCTYRVTVLMKNTGFDTCRFNIKQPCPASGLRVIYSPGPVAAGMKTDLQVDLFAMAIGFKDSEGEAYVSHHIEIQAENEILYLPVSATVLPERLFESRVRERTTEVQTGIARVHLLSSTPSVRRGVVLPHSALTSTGGNLVNETKH